MSSAVLTPPPTVAYPRAARWTCDEFHRLWDSGALEGKWVILVDGEMLEMAAPKHRHDVSLSKASRWMGRTFPDNQFWTRPQMGLPLNINTDPIPDLAVVAGAMDTFSDHPQTAELIVEISETSLAYDTGDKASLYAAAGIRDYWVVDLENRRVLVFRDPQPDASQKYGHGYASLRACGVTDSFSPLSAPQASVTAAELLP